jgi:hypothetical protein
VEGHRRYADEPEPPSWYSGPSQYDPAGAYDPGVHDRPGGAYRLPEQRPADPGYQPPAPYSTPDPLTTSGSHTLPPHDTGGGRVPVRGPEYPTVRPQNATSLADAPAPTAGTTYPTSSAPGSTYGASSPSVPSSALPMSTGAGAATEPTGVVPPVARFGTAPDPVYRTRRPRSALVIAIVATLLMVPVILLLIQVTFVDDPAVRGIVPAVMLALGLPLTAFGLHSLAAGGGPAGRDVWLRPPVAYLPVGLVLLLAAGLAVA